MRYLLLLAAILWNTQLVFATCEDHPEHKKPHAPASAKTKVFGKGIRLPLEQKLSLKEAISKVKDSSSQEFLLESKIHQVCQSSGCWLTMKEGKQEVRVTFENYSFFIPKDSAGKTARLQGSFMMREMSEKEAQHYAKDAKASKEEIAKIKGPQQAVFFTATGIEIL